jgi:hypothetical protein
VTGRRPKTLNASRPIRQLDRSLLLCQLPTSDEPLLSSAVEPPHHRAGVTAHAPKRTLGDTGRCQCSSRPPPRTGWSASGGKRTAIHFEWGCYSIT